MATDFLTDLELQHWLITGKFSTPTRENEWREILENQENRLQEEDLEEFIAPVIRGANDETPSSILIAHLGRGHTSFHQIETVFGDFGELTIIDRNPYYTEKGYVAVGFERERDAIEAYTSLNQPGRRVEKHLNRRIRCYYYGGEDLIAQTYSGFETSSQASSSQASTSSNRSTAQGSRVKNLRDLLEKRPGNSRIQDESVEIEEMLNQKEKKAEKAEKSSQSSAEVEELSPGICKICTVKVVDVAFIPCGHTACTSCFPQLNECCPFCRLTVIHSNKIYLS
ncbi:unnamed protein product, partial [Mesorhabditis belari]|uniref:RING-type domain-containing protein n=1 Tax=Mesorhabditis belari TaxID=2138241 RepID=A0AAF3EFR4_9BILA